ncbi:arylsulfatase [Oceanicoccus sagamiensis]|uniref:Sulfatase N-terminal domain-containing protein n=1 Tax=Oceanicoccus sagamiensis TaxID=716816 RepID=A0A1X9NDR5_9GAMM|nr:arylsulfatase [Oceanicoccus sagamiensis]ARN75204.1 hypothetical protein BST96_14415 [Oceanicoccus sagamiensis]
MQVFSFFLLLLFSLMYSTAQADTPRPNIVMILVDDAGLMDFQPFGSEARMPNIQQLADQGVSFTHYRTSPLCSPSRAMLLTGVDNHRTGVATIREVIPDQHLNQPGYSLSLEPGVKTIADHLRSAGYRTYMTGKWHMGDKVKDLPVSHGFDRSFVLDASGADNWEQRPYMAYYATAPWYEDDKPATLPEDFYSSEFIVSKMLEYLEGDYTTAEEQQKPFFAYLAFQAIHIPIQAPREFTENYNGVFDQGWHKLREQRWQKAQALGLVPEGAPLASIPEDLREWENLSDEERRYYAKAMQVNAGMLEAMDFHIGRLMQWLEERGELDNTVFVVTSDNGPEFNDMATNPGIRLWNAISGYQNDIETMGEKNSLVSIGPEWAYAAASPSKQFKFYTHDGGIRVPLIMSGPGLPEGERRSAFSLVTDITPTLLDYLQLSVKPEVAITGRSLKPVIEDSSAVIYGLEDAVGIEVAGNAALFKGDYKLSRNLPPYGDGQWRLFNVATDPGETQDLTDANPALFQQLLKDYQGYAEDFGVQAMPPGYNSIEMVTRNTVKKMFQQYRSIILSMLVVVVIIVVLIIRKFKKVFTMEKVIRGLTIFAGFLFVALGIRWVAEPEAIAAQLGMPLMEGTALNTQIGDMGAFFFAGGLMALIGVFSGKREWFYSAMLLIGSAGVFRVLALLVQDAELPIDKLVVEIVIFSLLLAASKTLTPKNE